MPATKRKIPERHKIENPRKMTKWEKQRVGREHARRTQGKKPVIEPLTMTEKTANGALILKNKQRTVSVQLMVEGEALQGVYRMQNGKIVIARSSTGPGVYPQKIRLYELADGLEKQIKDEKNQAYFEIPSGDTDLAHMYLPEAFRNTGLASRHASRTDRHHRKRQQGKNTVWMSEHRKELFEGIMRKIGYTQEKVNGEELWVYRKKGKVRETADLARFHLIEAIDPKTGRKREYAIPISQN